jgi:hypothetical protein
LLLYLAAGDRGGLPGARVCELSLFPTILFVKTDFIVGDRAGTLCTMNSRVGRIALIVVGVIAVATGAVWIGQGLNLIPGSVMSGDRMWFNIGVIVGLVGIVLVVLGARRPKSGV